MDGIRTTAAFTPEERKVEPRSIEDMYPAEDFPAVISVNPPSELELEALKKTYVSWPLFKTVVAKNTFIYTILTKGMDDEVIDVQQRVANRYTPQQMETLYREKVLQRCVLWPRDFKTSMLQQMPAGVEYALYTKIMNASGMNDPIYGDEALVKIAEMAAPDEETITKLKGDPRYQRLGLVYRKLNAVIVGEGGAPTTIPVGHFIYTAIERFTFNNVIQKLDQSPIEMDNKLLQHGLVWPKDFNWDETPAGWSRIIAQGIMEASGFAPQMGMVEDEQLA
jgi:hypothetical protein